MATAAPCVDKDILERFSLGQVKDQEATGLEDHLGSCAHCVEALHAIKAEDTLVVAMRAQSTLVVKPKIDETVSRLMIALKSLHPGSAPGVHEAPRSEYSAIEEMLLFLAPPQQPDEIGRLGSYRIQRVLGSGGMGVVFAAEDIQPAPAGRPEGIAALAGGQQDSPAPLRT